MSFRDDMAAARESRAKPVVVSVAVGDTLYGVEVRRLDGMQWAVIAAQAPPEDAASVRLGVNAPKAALIACKAFGRLLDADGEPTDMSPTVRDGMVESDPWDELFATISGIEVQAVAATWWGLNSSDPNENVVALKKASAGGSKTS